MSIEKWFKSISDQYGPDLPSESDASARMAWDACERAMLLDLWDALPSHENSDDPIGSIRAMLLLGPVGDEIRDTRLRKNPK